eukprot:CAMPEP_0194443670 /NCGR_PEP_ID=MMETSP0176-20130528/126840_1 /TAXON_ID=216777 /ORGANISM="Proboscia alata, Strain PI-D3" /LENGTH=1640 /DNA_ID=CAMNT_0039269957 /DNA_START=510 /DNA_END=5432 /DNA_ORIENTATION=-
MNQPLHYDTNRLPEQEDTVAPTSLHANSEAQSNVPISQVHASQQLESQSQSQPHVHVRPRRHPTNERLARSPYSNISFHLLTLGLLSSLSLCVAQGSTLFASASSDVGDSHDLDLHYLESLRSAIPQNFPYNLQEKLQADAESDGQLQQKDLGVGGLVEIDSCFAHMVSSDLDGDSHIGRNEYSTFADLMSDGYFMGGVNLDDMPLAFTLSFLNSACSGCTTANQDTCCVGGFLDIAGADGNFTQVCDTDVNPEKCDAQKEYLFEACMQVLKAVEYSKTEDPTPLPTVSPTVEASEVPSGVPTSRPTTATPTEVPSKEPSGSPNASPTDVPSRMPSKEPSGSPIASPTDVPSRMPSASPSRSPSLRPSISPTSMPSDSPTPEQYYGGNITVSLEASMRNDLFVDAITIQTSASTRGALIHDAIRLAASNLFSDIVNKYTLTINRERFPYGPLAIAEDVEITLIDRVCYDLESGGSPLPPLNGTSKCADVIASALVSFPRMTMVDKILVQDSLILELAESVSSKSFFSKIITDKDDVGIVDVSGVQETIGTLDNEALEIPAEYLISWQNENNVDENGEVSGLTLETILDQQEDYGGFVNVLTRALEEVAKDTLNEVFLLEEDVGTSGVTRSLRQRRLGLQYMDDGTLDNEALEIPAEYLISWQNENNVDENGEVTGLTLETILNEQEDYGGFVNVLTRALEEVAKDTLNEVFLLEDDVVRRSLRQRRLGLQYMDDSSVVTTITDAPCPDDIAAEGISCGNVDSAVTISILNEDRDLILQFYQATLLKNIVEDGALSAAMLLIDANSKMGFAAPAGSVIAPLPDNQSRAVPLSNGAIIGTCMAAFAVLSITAGGLYGRKRARDKASQMEEYEISEHQNYADDLSPQGGAYNTGRIGVAPHPYHPNAPNTRKQKSVNRGFAQLTEPNPYDGGHSIVSSEESMVESSQAGSSGWSSSAGVSSLHTGSNSSFDNDMSQTHGATLAQIGLASNVNRMTQKSLRGTGHDSSALQFHDLGRAGAQPRDNSSSFMAGQFASQTSLGGSVPKLPTVTRLDLNTAIENGDWAAVGATAALLASAGGSMEDLTQSIGGMGGSSAMSSTSASQTVSSKKSNESFLSGKSGISTMDAARAAELDHLVDTGDWEGVVLAAAKFETGDGSQTSLSSQRSLTTSSTPGTGIYSTVTPHSLNSLPSTAYSPSRSSAVSESPSAKNRLAEIRAEVERLVKRVVPDEIHNVDEMMHQFRGREEELVETLRTMQERSIAQRERAAIHRSAKREARQGSKQLPPTVARTPTAARSFSSRDAGRAGSKSFMDEDTIDPFLSMRDTTKQQPKFSEDPNSATNLGRSVSAGSTKPPDQGGLANLFGFFGGNKVPSFSNVGSTKDLNATSTPPENNNTSALAKYVDESKKSNSSRTALEMAIECGDWEAVGEAAAMMSDASLTSGSTGGGDSHDGTSRSSRSFGSAGRSGGGGGNGNKGGGGTKGGERSNMKASELDKMIDEGNWTGVVAAASQFNSTEDKQNTKNFADPNLSTTTASSTSTPWTPKFNKSASKNTSRRNLHPNDNSNQNPQLQEEQDALAQAEIWMAIAAQSKQEGTNEAKGASDAADWAISRSLSNMYGKEKKRPNTIPPRGSPSSSSAGEKSV